MMNYPALLCRNSNIFLPGTTAHKPNMRESAPGLCESVNKEGIRGMSHRCGEEGGARTAIDGAET